MFPTGTKLETYGYKYPIEDCTGTPNTAASATCYPGYLWNNGYIPAYRINSKNANGNRTATWAFRPSYKPAFQPLWPYPADYLSRSAATDPMYQFYGRQHALDSAQDRRLSSAPAWSGLDPLRQQYFPEHRQWGLDASAFKTVPITESVNVRFNADFFNVLNHPGNPNSVAGSTGILSTRNSTAGANAPRVLQLSLRLTW